ncbi:hypothetical protein ACFSKW_26390 [Nonomuraea mangrovi]|uniref:Helix-turn-helix domain-containing protein n=1 Tax=Nonomuraea mangrovi TaxID=2316207 RepID=A0ABW4T0M3_9ACTN
MNDTPDGATAQALRRLREAGGDGRSLDHESPLVIRRASVARMQAGERPTLLAEEYGFTRGTLHHDGEAGVPSGEMPTAPPAAMTDTRGSNGRPGQPAGFCRPPDGALRPEPLPARPEPTPEHLRALPAAILAGPQAAGLPGHLWTWELVAAYAAREFGVNLSEQRIRQAFAELQLWPGNGLARRRRMLRHAPDWWAGGLSDLGERAAADGAMLLVAQAVPLPWQRMLISAFSPARSGPTWFAIVARDSDSHTRGAELLRTHFARPLQLVTDPLSTASGRAFQQVAAPLRAIPLPDNPRHQLRYATIALEQARSWLSRRKDEHKAATAACAADRERENAARQVLCEQVARARAAGTGTDLVAAAAELKRNDVHNICKRTPVESATALAARSPAVLKEVARAAGAWRAAAERTRRARRRRDQAADDYRAARLDAQAAREQRDAMILLCHDLSQPTIEEIAEVAGVSTRLVHLVVDTAPRPADEGAGHLSRLDRAVGRWRDEHERLRELRAERDRRAEARRRARRQEVGLRKERDETIQACRRAGVPGVRIAQEVGLELAGTLSRLAGPTRGGRPDSPDAGQREIDRLREVSGRWREAKELLDRCNEALVRAEELRRSRSTVAARLRLGRDEALLDCRRKGVTLAVLSARTGLDSRTIREATASPPLSQETASL